MKKTYVYLLVLVAVILIVWAAAGDLSGQATAGTQKCADSDGGKNYAVAGIVTYKGLMYNDTCVSISGLKEWYCNWLRRPAYVTYTCPSGQQCSNGACISNVTTCTNECVSGARTCATTTAYKTCGNYDADACTEWSASIGCSTGLICSNGYCVSTNQTNTTG